MCNKEVNRVENMYINVFACMEMFQGSLQIYTLFVTSITILHSNHLVCIILWSVHVVFFPWQQLNVFINTTS